MVFSVWPFGVLEVLAVWLVRHRWCTHHWLFADEMLMMKSPMNSANRLDTLIASV